ncbi:MAG: glutathione peroxidase [Saprospiraceae bacterium]|nr:glutathione peroxidase [Saprospiraceae bacterium]
MQLLFFSFLLTVSFLSVLSAQPKTFHDFSAVDIDGKEVKMSDFKGKKVMVVNVASKCGNTPQYEGLERLYQKYGNEKFVIIGFPANNFMGQEPGSNEQIKAFCSSTYQVTFPMMAKISVKGKDKDPIYQWLTEKTENGVMDAEVTWNFQKFMIDENGQLVGVVKPGIEPECDEIINWIEAKTE